MTPPHALGGLSGSAERVQGTYPLRLATWQWASDRPCETKKPPQWVACGLMVVAQAASLSLTHSWSFGFAAGLNWALPTLCLMPRMPDLGWPRRRRLPRTPKIGDIDGEMLWMMSVRSSRIRTFVDGCAVPRRIRPCGIDALASPSCASHHQGLRLWRAFTAALLDQPEVFMVHHISGPGLIPASSDSPRPLRSSGHFAANDQSAARTGFATRLALVHAPPAPDPRAHGWRNHRITGVSFHAAADVMRLV